MAELDTPRRLENLQKLDELKKHLMDLEKQVRTKKKKKKKLSELPTSIVKFSFPRISDRILSKIIFFPRYIFKHVESLKSKDRYERSGDNELNETKFISTAPPLNYSVRVPSSGGKFFED